MTASKFSTEFKEIRTLVPGDVVVDQKYGARFVTSVSASINGDFTVRFNLPDANATDENTLTVDRFFGSAEVSVLVDSKMASEVDELRARLIACNGVIEIAKAQLAARDAALDAVIALCNDPNASMCDSPGESRMRNDFLNLLVKHGVHAK